MAFLLHLTKPGYSDEEFCRVKTASSSLQRFAPLTLKSNKNENGGMISFLGVQWTRPLLE